MNNEDITLNTEANDIAGNRIDGPVGNTAAKPGLPGAGMGIPGGPPAPFATDAARQSGLSAPTASASSEALAASETSMGAGAVEADTGEQENKEANPATLRLQGAYGGNFSNSTQSSYRDQDRRENQDSDPNRGEFGAQDLGGTTHGGFGNQNRLADYQPHGSAQDQYYGGSGRPGLQDNAYRAYDGRDERPATRPDYRLEPAMPVGNSVGPATDTGQVLRGSFNGPNADNRNQPDRADPNSAHQNDNGSAPGPDSGYASDYGRTSLRDTAGSPSPTAQISDSAVAAARNQTEDYLPAQGGLDDHGSTGPATKADQRSQHPASSQGYGDRGREEPGRSPDFRTGDDRTGYTQETGGNTAQGIGSRGGSYPDAYDDSRPGSQAGSPAQGDQRREDTTRNYGPAARQENRSDDEPTADHGAPRRNAGRDGEADE